MDDSGMSWTYYPDTTRRDAIGGSSSKPDIGRLSAVVAGERHDPAARGGRIDVLWGAR